MQNTFSENYGHIKHIMTVQERNWARAFEKCERGIHLGHIEMVFDALGMMEGRYLLICEEESACKKLRLNEHIQSALRGNPTRAEANAKHNKKRGQNRGIRKPKSNMYEAYDWQRDNGKTLDDDGEEVERGIATNPEENLAEAIHESQVRKCSLERLVEDYKLSKIAKADLLARTQKMTYEAMTYTFHGTQYMNLNYVLKGVNGHLYVQDQHDRIQPLELYLKRSTEDSFATHAEVWYPGQPGETWIFQPGAKSNIEGKAVKYEVR